MLSSSFSQLHSRNTEQNSATPYARRFCSSHRRRSWTCTTKHTPVPSCSNITATRRGPMLRRGSNRIHVETSNSATHGNFTAEDTKSIAVRRLGASSSIHHRASFFVIRRSKSSPATVCQQHGETTFSLFSLRPQWPGQKPSLSLGASILYKLGHVTLQDSQSGVVDLWNGQSLLISFNGSSPHMEIRRIDFGHKKTLGSRHHAKSPFPSSLNDTLCFCTEYILEKFSCLPSS